MENYLLSSKNKYVTILRLKASDFEPSVLSTAMMPRLVYLVIPW